MDLFEQIKQAIGIRIFLPHWVFLLIKVFIYLLDMETPIPIFQPRNKEHVCMYCYADEITL